MSEDKNNGASEKIYYEDSNVKVTNVRITCHHLTIPVDRIGSVDMNFKVENFLVSITCLVVSACPFLFLPVIPGKFKIPVAVVSLVLILASIVFNYIVIKNYVELIVSVAGRKVLLMSGSMGKRKYLEKICSDIGSAILDEKRYRGLKDSGQLESSMALNPSETLRVKMMLEDYEKLKKMKDEFTIKPNKTDS